MQHRMFADVAGTHHKDAPEDANFAEHLCILPRAAAATGIREGTAGCTIPLIERTVSAGAYVHAKNH